MDLEELSDKYRALKPQMRYSILAVAGLLPAVYLWMDTGDSLEVRRVQVEAEFATERQTFEDARQKAAELPALEAKLSEIEGELVKAKEFLPDRIEIDTILSFLGGLEKEFDVKLVRFSPGNAALGQGALEYKELPVELVMNGTFANTMRFMDRLVHMQNLTHLRNITFTVPDTEERAPEEGKEAPPPESSKRIDCNAKLILFKGV